MAAVLSGGKDAVHPHVFGAFTNCLIIDNRERIYPIRSVRDDRYTLIYCPNHRAVTSNVTLTQALNMLDGQAAKEEPDIAASWAKMRESDPRAEFLVNRLFHRPEYALFDRLADPYEERNLADDPAYQERLARLKSVLQSHLEAVGDADPVATERRIAGAGK